MDKGLKKQASSVVQKFGVNKHGRDFGQTGANPEGLLTMARMVMRTERLVAPRRPTATLVELKDECFETSAPFGASLVSWRS